MFKLLEVLINQQYYLNIDMKSMFRKYTPTCRMLNPVSNRNCNTLIKNKISNSPSIHPPCHRLHRSKFGVPWSHIPTGPIPKKSKTPLPSVILSINKNCMQCDNFPIIPLHSIKQFAIVQTNNWSFKNSIFSHEYVFTLGRENLEKNHWHENQTVRLVINTTSHHRTFVTVRFYMQPAWHSSRATKPSYQQFNMVSILPPHILSTPTR